MIFRKRSRKETFKNIKILSSKWILIRLPNEEEWRLLEL